MAIVDYLASLDVDGSVKIKTAPNQTGSILIWGASNGGVISTRTNSEFIMDLGLATKSEAKYTGASGIDISVSNVITPKYGTASNTIAQGNDSRINNGQTAFGWGNHATIGYRTEMNTVVFKPVDNTPYVAGDIISNTDFNTLPKGNYVATLNSTGNTNVPTDIGLLRGLFKFGANQTNLSNDIIIGSEGMSFRNSNNNIWRTVWTKDKLTKLSDLTNDLPSQLQNLSLGTGPGSIDISGGTGVSVQNLLPKGRNDATVWNGNTMNFTPYFTSAGLTGYPTTGFGAGLRIERYSGSTSYSGFDIYGARSSQLLWYKTFDAEGTDTSWKVIVDREWLSASYYNKNESNGKYISDSIVETNPNFGTRFRVIKNNVETVTQLLGNTVVDTRSTSSGLGSDGSTTFLPSSNSIPASSMFSLFHTTAGDWHSSIIVKGWSAAYASWKITGYASTSSGAGTPKDFYLSHTVVDGSWGPDYKIWTDRHFTQTDINNWNSSSTSFVKKIGDSMSGKLQIMYPGSAGMPNAVNSDPNNYVNQSKLSVVTTNNGLHFFGDGTTNTRVMAIQSGHYSEAYTSSVGVLSLNPFGGGVILRGGVLTINEDNTEAKPYYGQTVGSRDIGGFYMDSTSNANTHSNILRHRWTANNATYALGGVGSSSSGSMAAWGIYKFKNDRTVNGNDGFFGFYGDGDLLQASSLIGTGTRMMVATSGGGISTQALPIDTTYSVGNGLISSGTVFSLGAPGAITALTTSTVTANSHTHALTAITVTFDTAGLVTTLNGPVNGTVGGPRSGSVMGNWTTLNTNTAYGSGFFARNNQAWFLTKENGVVQTWQELAKLTDIVTYGVFTKTTNGLVPAPTGTTSTRYLREDNTWVVPTNTTYTNMPLSEATAGTVTTGRIISAKTINDLATAKGWNSGIFMYSLQGGIQTKDWSSFANGDKSIALGYVTSTSGFGEIAIGTQIVTKGVGNYNSGFTISNESIWSNLVGSYLQNKGDRSNLLGTGLVNYQEGHTVIGQYNKYEKVNNAIDGSIPLSTVRLFTIGNGDSDITTSNAFEMYRDGSAELAGLFRYRMTVALPANIPDNTLVTKKWVVDNAGGGGGGTDFSYTIVTSNYTVTDDDHATILVATNANITITFPLTLKEAIYVRVDNASTGDVNIAAPSATGDIVGTTPFKLVMNGEMVYYRASATIRRIKGDFIF